jgi:ribosomal-protein-alanine N-acetyltransferase
MKLLPATSEDAASLARLHAAAFDPPWTAREFAELMEGPGVFALAAEAPDGDLAGFILCRAVAGEAEILTLAVPPARRRRGVALALTLAAGLAATGCEAMFLEVGEDNPAAVALYEKAGFAPVGRRPGYYDRGNARVDALVMRRTLNR